MATRVTVLLAVLAVGLRCGSAQEPPVSGAGPGPGSRVAASRALERGALYLLSRQDPEGAWLQHPAITALAALALVQMPGETPSRWAAAADRALDFAVRFAQADGSIWAPGEGQYPNYSTSICLIALVTADRPQDRDLMRRARAYLLGPSQFGQVAESDPSYGGIGYGKTGRPDLSNTQWALEALYLSRHLDREPYAQNPTAAPAQLAWARALTFLTRCQNLAETNASGWVTSDPENRGGFIYFPGADEEGLPPESKAGDEDLAGVKALRSYGSMAYAGLKSMIYAQVGRDDPRVRAAVDWVRRHYTFAENPGIGAQGLYYYLHTAAKALQAYGEESFADAAGIRHPWRQELSAELTRRQQSEGSWCNQDSGRWMESIPELTTCYALLSLQIALGPGTGGPAAPTRSPAPR